MNSTEMKSIFTHSNQEPERRSVSERNSLVQICPFGQQNSAPQHCIQGRYENGFPKGALIHYTAGPSATSAFNMMAKHGYLYWIIDFNGAIYQTAELRSWGYHAGQSQHPEIGPRVSKHLLGIEIVSPGRLTTVQDKYFTWWGDEVDPKSVRKDKKGVAYAAFTDAQEASLFKLCRWLKQNAPSVFSVDMVLGHEEVAPQRKTDPGASLSCSMNEFRAALKDSFKPDTMVGKVRKTYASQARDQSKNGESKPKKACKSKKASRSSRSNRTIKKTSV